MLPSVQVNVTDAPGAIEARAGSCALVRSQPGARASVTRTLVSVTLPEFATVIDQVAVEPLGMSWSFGFFVIDTAGLLGACGVGGGAMSSLVMVQVASPARPTVILLPSWLPPMQIQLAAE